MEVLFDSHVKFGEDFMGSWRRRSLKNILMVIKNSCLLESFHNK